MDNVVNTSDLDIDYVLIYKDRNLILDNINLSENDRFICDAIIDNLESEVAKQVKAGKTVSIPFIGTIENNWYKKAIREKYSELKEYKNTHTKEEYKEYFKAACEDIKKNHSIKEEKVKSFNRFKTKMLPKYVNLCNKRGVNYANAWLKMINRLSVVEFDPDIEEVYERFRLGLDVDD